MYTSNEPCGAFTCGSSTLTVLADSGLFHGLLLTVLGSRIDFHGYQSPGCVYVSSSTLTILANFVPFWVPRVISMIDDPLGAFTCRYQNCEC